MKRKRCFFLTLTLLWLAVIFGHSMQSAEVSAAESGSILRFVQKLLPFMTEHFLRKAAHLSEFFILGVLLRLTCRCFDRASVCPPLLFGVISAMTDETIQLFSPGRACQVTDVWIDTAGVACGVGVLCLWALIRKKRKKE